MPDRPARPRPQQPPRLEVRRSADRATTRTVGITSRHSFSFGGHYDPANTSFGVLLASNEDVLEAGAGYDDHPHRAVEIVTWVLSGRLAHRDRAGGAGVVGPGTVQRLSAGGGVVHAERNPSDTEPVHLVQMWVAAGPAGGDPSYAQADVSAALTAGGLVLVASGRPDRSPAVQLRQPGAELFAGRLRPGAAVELPLAPYLHLFVARGNATLHLTNRGARTAGQDERLAHLAAGDAARLAHVGGEPAAVAAAGEPGAEVLVWAMTATVHPG